METTTITWGECAENHAGMERFGTIAAAGTGFTLADFVAARDRFAAAGLAADIVHLVEAARVEDLDPPPEPAYLFIVRGGAEALGPPAGGPGPMADALGDEQDGLRALRDKKALMRGRVVNKLARHNLCFTPAAQEPDYESGRGRVVAFADLPELSAARARLPAIFGEKASEMFAEGNYYYDTLKCGIGFHGDSERRRVIAMRFGAPMALHFQWFLRGAPVGLRIAPVLFHGDLYAFSEKAAGTDWRRKVVPTLRHAAGAPKYLEIAGFPAEYAADL